MAAKDFAVHLLMQLLSLFNSLLQLIHSPVQTIIHLVSLPSV